MTRRLAALALLVGVVVYGLGWRHYSYDEHKNRWRYTLGPKADTYNKTPEDIRVWGPGGHPMKKLNPFLKEDFEVIWNMKIGYGSAERKWWIL